jgi:hypothetical protein
MVISSVILEEFIGLRSPRDCLYAMYECFVKVIHILDACIWKLWNSIIYLWMEYIMRPCYIRQGHKAPPHEAELRYSYEGLEEGNIRLRLCTEITFSESGIHFAVTH